jgi:ribose transport system substrate-binding protein
MRNSSSEVVDGAQSVLRACQLVRAFRREGEVLVLADLMDRTRLPKTTVFRLLQSLVQGGLVEKAGRGEYRSLVKLAQPRSIRLGFAAQTDSEFSRAVTDGLTHAAAANDGVQLITVNNRYSAREALRNAELLIRDRVDLVLEFQTYQRVAPIVASKFLDANIPVIAMEIPHPGATYFGANNYQAGQIAGKALGHWAKENWQGQVEQIVLLELPIAGPLLELRMTGFLDGLREELSNLDRLPVARLDGKGTLAQVLGKVRKYLHRITAKRTLVGCVNDLCAVAAVRAFEEIGRGQYCAVVGQNGTLNARQELRRPGTRLVGSVAYFPERYGEELVKLALAILQGKPVPQAVFVKHRLLTPENVDLIYPFDAK